MSLTSIELTDFSKLPIYSPFKVSELQADENAIGKCLSIIKKWKETALECKSPTRVQLDYQFVVKNVVELLENFKDLRRPGEKFLAAFSKEGNLEGIAITQNRKSTRNKIPFIEVSYLLTAVHNVFSDKEEKTPQVKGAGCALLAKAIKLEDKGKCLYLSSLSSAESFYEKIGFIRTTRQTKDLKCYKLPAKNFGKFILQRAINVSFA